jgi:hypothetical protein
MKETEMKQNKRKEKKIRLSRRETMTKKCALKTTRVKPELV